QKGFESNNGCTAPANYYFYFETSGFVDVSSISVSPTVEPIYYPGGTDQLTATVSPSNATNQAVTWTTNTPSVATVSSTGLVTAQGTGTATITATSISDPNVSGSYTVTVDGYSSAPVWSADPTITDVKNNNLMLTWTSDCTYATGYNVWMS